MSGRIQAGLAPAEETMGPLPAGRRRSSRPRRPGPVRARAAIARRAATLCLALLPSLAPAPSVTAQENETWREMNRPVEPFRIVGNVHYVGASDIAVFLITTPKGHILIDGGFEETVPIVRRGVEKLGFRLEDVRILLHSHAHIDHAGGLARLKELTGAVLLASSGDAPALERGGKDDPLMGDAAAFPPVKVDRGLEDGDTVELGGVILTARVTAGHTPGCTTWVWNVTDGGRTYLAVSIGSVTVLEGTRFLAEPTYPGIREDYARAFGILRSLPADVFLASHASFFRMRQKRERAGDDGNPFIDPEGYRAFVERGESRYRAALEREGAATPAPPPAAGGNGRAAASGRRR